VPLFPPQIQHGLTRARSRVSAMRGRWLTAWAIARPSVYMLQMESLETFSHFEFSCSRWSTG
jgi:hypothetical protein